MKGNRLTIAVMFGMVFMVGFVTMFTGPLAAVVKAQFGASNALSQFGSSANFLAYLFMGLPCGMVLKRRGYRFTSLAAVSVGILGKEGHGIVFFCCCAVCTWAHMATIKTIFVILIISFFYTIPARRKFCIGTEIV